MPAMQSHHPTTLDPEGRLTVVRPMRERFGLHRETGQFVATYEPRGCIVIRSEKDWAQLAELAESTATGPEEVEAAEIFSNYSFAITHDKQGRIRVADSLLTLAGFDRREARDGMLAGHANYIAIWSLQRWKARTAHLVSHGRSADSVYSLGWQRIRSNLATPRRRT